MYALSTAEHSGIPWEGPWEPLGRGLSHTVSTPQHRRPGTRHSLEIVRLGVPRLCTWRKQKQGFEEKTIWPPMALRLGLLRSSALQNDGRIEPVMLQRRSPQETKPKGHWGPNCFFINSFFCFLHAPSLGIPSLTICRPTQRDFTGPTSQPFFGGLKSTLFVRPFYCEVVRRHREL